MTRALVVALTVAAGTMWLGLVTTPGLHHPDASCPAEKVRIRYPEHLADYHDGEGSMKHYRVAYCKPTGIDWREAP